MSQSTKRHSSGSIPSAKVKIFLSYVPTITVSYLRESKSAEIKPSTSGDIISLLENFKVCAIEFLIFKTSLKECYNLFIMSVLTWSELTLTILSIVALIAAGIKWLVKHYFEEIKSELKPNSGSSLKDQVTRLEQRTNEADILRKDMNKKLDHMYDILIEYISKNSK